VWWSIAAVALVVGVVSIVGTLPTKDPKVVVLSQAPAKAPAKDPAKDPPRDSTKVPAKNPAKVPAKDSAKTPAQDSAKDPTMVTAKSQLEFSAIPRSRPVKLTIPSISVNTHVGTLGLQPDHQVMVPTNTHTVGWYLDGPTPGQIGSAVILGHVDSFSGPGTFFDLKLLKAGDRLNLVLADGTVTNFVVTKVVQYSKNSFPDRVVYGSNGTRSLQLVTCGGTFDHETGHYESNIVVFSQLVKVSIPKDVVRS
jgi:sortase (surface protein transpeptidase)